MSCVAARPGPGPRPNLGEMHNGVLLARHFARRGCGGRAGGCVGRCDPALLRAALKLMLARVQPA